MLRLTYKRNAYNDIMGSGKGQQKRVNIKVLTPRRIKYMLSESMNDSPYFHEIKKLLEENELDPLTSTPYDEQSSAFYDDMKIIQKILAKKKIGVTFFSEHKKEHPDLTEKEINTTLLKESTLGQSIRRKEGKYDFMIIVNTKVINNYIIDYVINATIKSEDKEDPLNGHAPGTISNIIQANTLFHELGHAFTDNGGKTNQLAEFVAESFAYKMMDYYYPEDEFHRYFTQEYLNQIFKKAKKEGYSDEDIFTDLRSAALMSSAQAKDLIRNINKSK